MNWIDRKTVIRRNLERNPIICKPLIRATRPNPWRDYQKKSSQVFIHIPRTAGGSIVKSIPPGVEVGHIPLYVYKAWDSALYTKSFKYSFVRNPWDRLVSAYHRVAFGAKNPLTKDWGERNLSSLESFEEFIVMIESDKQYRDVVLSYPHFRPQAEFICIDGVVSVDFLGRFESLGADFEVLCNHLGLNGIALPHEHQSKRSDFRNYYNKNTRKIVEELYCNDISLFDYRFDI